MTPKSVRVSIYQQICHEISRAAKRHLRNSSSAEQIETEVQKLSNDGIKELTKYAIAFVVIAVLVSNLSDGAFITIRTTFVELSLPKVYCAFVASFLWFSIVNGGLLQFQYLTMKAILRNLEVSWKPFSDIETAFRGNNLADLTGPFRNDHLYNLSKTFRFFAGTSFMLSMALVLVPLFGAYALMISVSIEEFTSPSGIYLARSIAASSLALLILPVFYVVLFFIPVRVHKNKRAIRWRFLASIFRGMRSRHPQAARWLKDK